MVRACSVSNLSRTGATLRLGEADRADSRFRLLIDGEPRPRQCELAWTAPAELGVRFVPLAEAKSPPRWGNLMAWA